MPSRSYLLKRDSCKIGLENLLFNRTGQTLCQARSVAQADGITLKVALPYSFVFTHTAGRTPQEYSTSRPMAPNEIP